MFELFKNKIPGFWGLSGLKFFQFFVGENVMPRIWAGYLKGVGTEPQTIVQQEGNFDITIEDGLVNGNIKIVAPTGYEFLTSNSYDNGLMPTMLFVSKANDNTLGYRCANNYARSIESGNDKTRKELLFQMLTETVTIDGTEVRFVRNHASTGGPREWQGYFELRAQLVKI